MTKFITQEGINDSRKIIWHNPCGPIIRKPMGRKNVLETNEDLPIKEVKAWIKSIKI